MYISRCASVLLGLILSHSLAAQFNLGFSLSNEIPVLHGTDTLYLAWAGGLNNPQFSMTSLDFKGEKDLFAFDLDGALRKGFVYNTARARYEWKPYIERYFPAMPWGYCLLRDYDRDGKEDIFTNGFSYRGFTVYRNTSDTNLKFELVKERLQYRNPGKGIKDFEMGRLSVPIIEDLDADDDLDIVFFTFIPPVDCSTFGFFQNQSQEEYSSSDSLEYTVTNRCWGHIAANGANPGGWRPYNCDTTCNPLDGNRADISLTQSSFDLNGDGLEDLLVSKSHDKNLYALTNTTENVNAEMDATTVDVHFPSSDVPVDLPNEPMPYFLDIDHDGYKDFIAAPNQLNVSGFSEIDTSLNIGVDHYYRNYGSSSSPDFRLEKKGFLASEMVDVGMRSFPVFVDLSGDGLPDMVVGNQGFSALGGESGAFLTYYKNIGTAGHPAYKLVTKDLAEIRELGFAMAHPALADLDDDGDYDLIVGDDQGYLHYFKNKGTPNTYDFHLNQPMFSNIKVGMNAHPQFFDLNSDGLPDLLVGDGFGMIDYHENSGTATEFDFSSTPTIEKIGDLFLYHGYGGETTPFFSRDIDSSDNLYAFMSTKLGAILVYGPITNITEPFTVSDVITVEATFTSITGSDLLGDGRHELVVGQQTGGVYLLKRVKDIPAGVGPEGQGRSSLELFPNPTEGMVTLRMRQPLQSEARLTLTDLAGKVILSETISSSNGFYQKNLDLRPYPGGVYLVSFVENGSVHWSRLVKQ